jgi:hypothetical protein
MGFLDNLENSLKNLESRDETDGQRDRERREEESNAARAAAPYADLLRNSPFTAGLLEHATRLGFAKRMKVHIVWLGTTLRLEARDKKLDLRPAPEGIVAVFIENGREVRNQSVDLDAKPETLAREWLGG